MGTIILTIPVYSMTEKDFDNRWNTKIETDIEKFVSNGCQREEATRIIRRLYFPQTIWKYNHIIGYVEITSQQWSIFYDLYIPTNKRFAYNRKGISYSQNIGLNGWHFYVDEKQTNEEIVLEMRKWLFAIQKEHLPKGLYLDTSVFESLINFVDIKLLLKERSTSENNR